MKDLDYLCKEMVCGKIRASVFLDEYNMKITPDTAIICIYSSESHKDLESVIYQQDFDDLYKSVNKYPEDLQEDILSILYHLNIYKWIR